MFFSISFWGFQQGKSNIAKWAIAIACFIIAVVLWGIFAAPNSQSGLSFPLRLVFEFSMFLLAAILLYRLNMTLLSIVFAVMAIASVTVAYVFRQKWHDTSKRFVFEQWY